MPPTRKSPHRLLVEGVDDLHSVIHLLKRHAYDWDNAEIVRPFVHDAGGIDELLEELPVTLKGPYDRIGILVDANGSSQNRWAQIRDRAMQAGLDLPKNPAPQGIVVQGLRPDSRIGVWMMPDNSSPGRLEDFLHKLVPESDAVWTWADEVVQEARNRGARCKEGDHLKSRLHTWLAWQERPGIPFGTALEAQVFRHDTEEALRFVAWFNRLFVDV
jgi:hypothetical protein